MAQYGGVCEKLTTKQGFSLALGLLCPKGDEKNWEARCAALRELRIEDAELFDVDYLLAAALRDLLDESVPVAGAAIRVPAFPSGSTGGVIGCPRRPILASEGEAERLADGFLLFTRPGGPGLAAEGEAEELAGLWKSLCSFHLPEDREHVCALLSKLGTGCALAVYDGSGEACGGVFVLMESCVRWALTCEEESHD
jgi:hypothetical protein